MSLLVSFIYAVYLYRSTAGHNPYNLFILTIVYSKNIPTSFLRTIERMTMFVVKSIHIQINSQVMDLSITLWPFNCWAWLKQSHQHYNIWRLPSQSYEWLCLIYLVANHPATRPPCLLGIRREMNLQHELIVHGWSCLVQTDICDCLGCAETACYCLQIHCWPQVIMWMNFIRSQIIAIYCLM